MRFKLYYSAYISDLKTTFVTDSYSTLAGLASVAYGNPNYFREVKNQIYSTSPTKFVNTQSPSDVFSSMVPSFGKLTENIIDYLEDEYDKDGDFSDYVDITMGARWREEFKQFFSLELLRSMDNRSTYNENLSSYILYSLKQIMGDFEGAQDLALNIVLHLKSETAGGNDLSLITRTISNNPQNKISVPPKDARISLETGVELGLDHRGVEFIKGYLTPADYFANIPIPGMKTTSILPVNIRDSVIQGYTDYPVNSRLESLFNPSGAVSIEDISNPNEAIASTDPFMANSVLGTLPSELQADRDVYGISLMGELINGYTTFDPGTMSNGDLVDKALTPSTPPGSKLPGLLQEFVKAYG